jgi:large subunit ribosomal protein L24
MARIRKGDMVEVIAGNDKGAHGRVLRLLNDKNRVVVEGVNLRWKHMRKSQQQPQGGRVRREMPIHMSNVMLYDEGAGARTRIGFQGEGNKKVRVSRKTGAEIGAAAAEPKKAKKKAAKKKAAKKKAAKKAEGKES